MTQAAAAPAVHAVGAKGALFEDQAAAYAKYRFVYPNELYSALLEFGGQPLRDPATRRLALDVATGTGQVAVVLADLFEQVVACDTSQGQLSHAAQRFNVRYELAPAERLPAADASVDLVTCAQALHWFDVPAFYAEAARALRPEGTLAVWGYSTPQVASSSAHSYPPEALEQANRLLDELYDGTLGPFWDDKRRLVERRYQGLEPGPDSFGRVERRELTLGKEMSLNSLFGYLSSWSAYAAFKRHHPELPDPLVAFKQQFAAALAIADDGDDAAFLVEMPLFLLLAREPIKHAA